MYALTLISLSVFVGQTMASVIDARSAITSLMKRQVGFDPSTIPQQCTQDCSFIVNVLNTCTDVSCLCSANANNGLYTCLECTLEIVPDASLLSQEQSSLKGYEDSCKQAGATVNSLTLTMPSGSTQTGSTGTGTVGTTTSVGAVLTTTKPSTTRAVSDPTTTDSDADDTETDDASVDNPLETAGAKKGNGAGLVAVSSAALLGAVGAAIGAFLTL
ncbi:hypothetical protein C8Q80DRAFT_1275751 [Daedaleopsis nitida]|nr:hypothetical protein C8Q80DRAFT_1275751 [Daedaleopsis nitida]